MCNSMNVLYCYKFGILGGVCTQLINRLEVLSRQGDMRAEIVFWKDMGISESLAGYPIRFEKDPEAVRRLIRERKFDVVVVIDTPEYLEAFGRERDFPLVTEVHTTTELGLGYLKERNWSTDGYIVPSEYSRQMLRERFGVGTDAPVEVVPNSIDRRLFPRAESAIPGSRPVFAWVGKLDDHKDWRTFLSLAARICERIDAEFWIVGGETAPAHRVEEFIDACERLALHPHCRWFPRIEYRAIHRMHAAVRQSGGAALMTSINESFGMAVLEALMCGVPVVASRVGALPEIAPDAPYVRFYELGDVETAAALAVESVGDTMAADLRRALDADLPHLLDRYASENVGPRYLQTLRALACNAG